MSKTKGHTYKQKGKIIKLPNKRTGWLGESYWRASAKRFIKRIQRRASRRFWNIINPEE